MWCVVDSVSLGVKGSRQVSSLTLNACILLVGHQELDSAVRSLVCKELAEPPQEFRVDIVELAQLPYTVRAET